MDEVELYSNRSAYKPSPEIINKITSHIIYLEEGLYDCACGKVVC